MKDYASTKKGRKEAKKLHVGKTEKRIGITPKKAVNIAHSIKERVRAPAKAKAKAVAARRALAKSL